MVDLQLGALPEHDLLLVSFVGELLDSWLVTLLDCFAEVREFGSMGVLVTFLKRVYWFIIESF